MTCTISEATFIAAIVAAPADELCRLAYADWLLEQGRHEQAERVRETANIRPEQVALHSWWLWRPVLRTNEVHKPSWLTVKNGDLEDDAYWPTESEGMAAIMAAVLEGPR